MGRIRYGVAMSLDGFIAGPGGESDWIVIDPAFDFAKLWLEFDTLLMGRRTWEAAIVRLGRAAFEGMRIVVMSRTLKAAQHPDITILSEMTRDAVLLLRAQSGKDIWLMGGGEIFRLLLTLDEIDTVEVRLIPVLLGAGVPLLPTYFRRTRLRLASHVVYPSGSAFMVYEVQQEIASC